MKTILKHLIFYKYPNNWGFIFVSGFLLFFVCFIQIISGISLYSVVLNGLKILKPFHSFVAAVIVFLAYAHFYKSVYYRVTIGSNDFFIYFSGMASLVFLILTAFSGYGVTWGQVSFWGTKVITSFLDVIPIFGERIKVGLWGSTNLTKFPIFLRFCSLHTLVSLGFWVSLGIHVYLAHEKKSASAPLTSIEDCFRNDYLYPNAYIKDFFIANILACLFALYLLSGKGYFENFLNNIEVSYDKTPFNILPEWFFYISFSILKFIEHRFFGVVIGCIILFFMFLPIYSNRHSL